jgi:hypothetical protein
MGGTRKQERDSTIRKVAKLQDWYVGEERVFIKKGELKATLIANAPGLADKTLAHLEDLEVEAAKKAAEEGKTYDDKISFLMKGQDLKDFDPF